MVVCAINVVYGIRLTVENFNKLLKADFIQWDDFVKMGIDIKSDDDLSDFYDAFEEGKIDFNIPNVTLIKTPHEVRWTDYDGGVVYLGIDCGGYAFESYEDYPFQKRNKKSEEKFKDLLTNAGIDETPNYEIIPNDCNCCS